MPIVNIENIKVPNSVIFRGITLSLTWTKSWKPVWRYMVQSSATCLSMTQNQSTTRMQLWSLLMNLPWVIWSPHCLWFFKSTEDANVVFHVVFRSLQLIAVLLKGTWRACRPLPKPVECLCRMFFKLSCKRSLFWSVQQTNPLDLVLLQK